MLNVDSSRDAASPCVAQQSQTDLLCKINFLQLYNGTICILYVYIMADYAKQCFGELRFEFDSVWPQDVPIF